MIPVFIDCAERSPTFHLFPLDTVGEQEKKCWLQVWTDAEDQKAAWTRFLGRPFRGLDKENYYPHFVIQITDSCAPLASVTISGEAIRLSITRECGAPLLHREMDCNGHVSSHILPAEADDNASLITSVLSRTGRNRLFCRTLSPAIGLIQTLS